MGRERARTLLGYAYLAEGQTEQARREFRQQAEGDSSSPAVMQVSIAESYAADGNRKEAEELLTKGESAARHACLPAYLIARVYGCLAQKDACFKWLAKSYRMHDPHLAYLRVDPGFDSIRSDPRAQHLLRETGFAN